MKKELKKKAKKIILNDINFLFASKWTLFFIYLLLCIFGLLNFKLWGQVISIWNNMEYVWNGGAEHLTLSNHAHTLRFYLVRPLFELSRITNISYDYLFTLLIPFILLIITSNINKTISLIKESLTKKQLLISFNIVYLSLCFISLFMNGRMFFAVIAASILLQSAYSWKGKPISSIIFYFFIGLFLSSVSSGIFVIYLFSYLAIAVFYVLKDRSNKNKKLLLIFSIITLCIHPLLLMFIFKNINFYGGGDIRFYQYAKPWVWKNIFPLRQSNNKLMHLYCNFSCLPYYRLLIL